MTTLSAGRGNTQHISSDAVLVTGPRCVVVPSPNQLNDSFVVHIESEQYKDVDVSENILDYTCCKTNSKNSFESSCTMKSTNFTNDDGTEMEEIVRTNSSNKYYHEGFDTCREYSYKCTDDEDDDNDDDDDDNLYEYNDIHEITKKPSVMKNEVLLRPTKNHSGQVTKCMQQNVQRSRCDVVYILGRQYHAVLDYDARRSDELSLFWFTYRCDFPSMDPYGITSDAGWGCMLRATQMLLAQSLRMHYKGRDWRPSTTNFRQSLSYRRSDPFVRSLLTWFADFPSSNSFDSGDSMYSLHNMVAVGLTKYDKLPGEWYGPGTACYVLRDLVHRHEQQQDHLIKLQQKIKLDGGAASGNPETPARRIFRVHVASSDGAVYRDEIHRLMTRNRHSFPAKQVTENKEDYSKPAHVPSHPLDVSAWEDELIEMSKNGRNRELVKWDTSLLLLIPLRLGLRNFNPDYAAAVAHTFSLPQSVGVLGGRPRGARWFFGAQVSSGNESKQVFGLDPHTVQVAPRRRTATVNGISKQVVELSDEYLQSIHSTFTETFSLEKMDPSIALGFYCRNHEELEHVFECLHRFRTLHPKSPELFHVQDTIPDYENVSKIDSLAVVMNDDSIELEPPSSKMSATARVGELPLFVDSAFNNDDDDEFVIL